MLRVEIFGFLNGEVRQVLFEIKLANDLPANDLVRQAPYCPVRVACGRVLNNFNPAQETGQAVEKAPGTGDGVLMPGSHAHCSQKGSGSPSDERWTAWMATERLLGELFK